MVEFTKANGATTTCMAVVYTHGPMEGAMRETTKMIKRMDLENTLGQMGASTRVLGRMENSTVKESTSMQMDTVEQESGSMGREPPGSITNE